MTRRFGFLASSLAAAAGLLIVGAATQPGETSSQTLTVGAHAVPVTLQTQVDHRCMIEAACLIPAAPAVVWRVLSDYNHLHEIVPFLTESRGLREEGGAKILYQAGRGQLWFFTRRFTVTFRVIEQPEALITFKAFAGDFREFDGFWSLEPQPEGTFVRHSVTINPDFYMPKWAMRFLARHLMMTSLSGVLHRCLD